MKRALTIVLACFAAIGGASAIAGESRRPNVLVFLCDDTGWGEIGFQGNTEIPTPHIDSIAKNGVRFVQGYVSGPYCSPTRAGLLTGRYQTRFGHEFNNAAAGKHGLSLDEKTMAERLKPLGYATCAVGKWHLGVAPEYRPTKRGFDEFYGTLANTPFFRPRNFVDSRVSNEVQEVNEPNFYTTNAYGDRAVDWLDKQKDRPWFLYMAFNAQHAPLEAPQKYLDRFEKISDPKRRTFAAMMSAMDDATGKILAKVRALGQEEHTVIFFLSDNGGPTRSTTSKNGPLRGFKATTWEGGVRVPFAAQWKGKLPAGKTYEQPVIQLDILPTALAAAGATVDSAWKLDGVNLLPLLLGEKSAKPHETLYWRFGDQWAIRHGDWKLVSGREGGAEPWLINLAEDTSESKNLGLEQPGKAKELKALWDKWNAEQAAPIAGQERPGRSALAGERLGVARECRRSRTLR
ncbi:MAG: sulfatase family protein [Verrucomicrobiales bacterium]